MTSNPWVRIRIIRGSIRVQPYTAEVEEEAEEDPEDHQALTANRIRVALEKGEGSKDGVKDALRQGF